jgi:hypothetical protein
VPPAPAAARDAKLAKAKYLDPKVPVDKRVADLLGRMTPEEKIAQLTAYWFPKSGVMTTTSCARRSATTS